MPAESFLQGNEGLFNPGNIIILILGVQDLLLQFFGIFSEEEHRRRNDRRHNSYGKESLHNN